jgi:hypothetical protein
MLLAFMRRLMNVMIGVGLICAGAYMLYGEIFFKMSGPGSRIFGAGLVFIGSGFAWLWYDSLGPIILQWVIERRATRARNAPPK